MVIVEYEPKYKEDFGRLTREWIERYFVMEPEDYATLEEVEDRIREGAQVFFALEDEEVIGTCMAQPLGDGAWEICKLAMTPAAQGRGTGSALFCTTLDYIRAQNPSKILIVSNRSLENALHIYEKFGFREVPVDDTHSYERGDIQLEYAGS